ncbi:MAG: purine-binding chemotaxis protein CheW [Synechococcales cyanobacterium RM1_1_8]|nr:purine-binding chemotaxis protein CheW [Synechococcales cyanobacterium RM1_1_8]
MIRQADKISESISELNLAALVESEQSTAGMLSIVKIDGEGEKEIGLKSFFERYCPNASAAELAIFRQRAAMLQAPLETFQEEASNSLAVIRLGGEYFGIRLEVVREFIQISAMTPVPCCPSHILGNLNLRGEIMTVMGIHDYLNVASPQRAAEKAIVIEVNGIVAGVAADQVCDIVQLSQQQISPVPAATTSSRKSYFSGIAPYGENVLGILDFSKLIQAERLVVNEAI